MKISLVHKSSVVRFIFFLLLYKESYSNLPEFSFMDGSMKTLNNGHNIVTNTPSSQGRLLNGSECKFILRQVRPNLFCQVLKNLHKAVCGLQSLIFRRRHQKSLQLWWMMQTGILIFSSWKKPPITGEMCS